MKKRRTIRYLGLDGQSTRNSDVKVLKYYSVNVEGAAAKIYHNVIPLLCKLSKNQIVLLLFILKKVDSKGCFKFNKQLKEEFNKFSHETGNKTHSDRTLARWISDITQTEVIIKENKGRGNYKLSPVFFGQQIDQEYNEREKELRKKLEKPITNQVAQFRAEAMAEKELLGILKDVVLLPS